MPPKKRKKLSKSAKKKIFKELTLSGNKARGSGVGGRKNFVLPARWETQHVEQTDGKVREQYLSPGKTLYKTQKGVESTFETRDKKGCLPLENNSTSSDNDEIDKDPDFDVSTETDNKSRNMESESEPEEMENRMFVCQTPQLLDFIEQINRTSQCATPGCKGNTYFSKRSCHKEALAL